MFDQIAHVLELKHVMLAIAGVTSLVLMIQALKNREAEFGNRVVDKQADPRTFWAIVALRGFVAVVVVYLGIV
jgi:hypothetical protein